MSIGSCLTSSHRARVRRCIDDCSVSGPLFRGDALDFRGRFLVKSRTQAIGRKVAVHFPHVCSFKIGVFDPLIKATKYDLFELKLKKFFFNLEYLEVYVYLIFIPASQIIWWRVCILYWQSW